MKMHKVVTLSGCHLWDTRAVAAIERTEVYILSFLQMCFSFSASATCEEFTFNHYKLTHDPMTGIYRKKLILQV